MTGADAPSRTGRARRASRGTAASRPLRVGRALLHGFLLAVVSIGSILVGYAVYVASGLRDQIAIQVLVAGALCAAAFAVLGWVLHRASSGRLSLVSLRELGAAYASAFLWSAVIFVPLHYITQGYLTALGNVLGIWLFQLPFNLLSLLIANGRLLQESVERQERAAE
ncbi:MAG: hypothetical protein JXB46_03680 [Candidatus Eisenbacteria bacterium]|nr:hypothetical protein [Candidatus Eisenbacteria bacterium]